MIRWIIMRIQVSKEVSFQIKYLMSRYYLLVLKMDTILLKIKIKFIWMKDKSFKKLETKRFFKIWMNFRTWKMFQILWYQTYQRISIYKKKNRNQGIKI